MTARAAYGVQIEIDNAGYSVVANVRDIQGPSLSADAIDVTAHDSTGGWREFVAGLIDGGEVTLNILYDPGETTHGNTSGILSELTGRTVEGFRITWPGSSGTMTFDALVTGFQPGAPVEDRLSADVTLKVTGAVTIA